MPKHDLVDRDIQVGKDRLVRFLLWDRQWRQCKTKVPLKWESIAAKRTNANLLPAKQGVYAFVVRPGICDMNWAGYILYIGKTENQSFRKRFPQYFAEANAEKPRFWVRSMFRLWPKHLFYYFAETSAADADSVESALLKALLPPNNERFPGKFAAIKKEIYR